MAHVDLHSLASWADALGLAQQRRILTEVANLEFLETPPPSWEAAEKLARLLQDEGEDRGLKALLQRIRADTREGIASSKTFLRSEESSPNDLFIPARVMADHLDGIDTERLFWLWEVSARLAFRTGDHKWALAGFPSDFFNLVLAVRLDTETFPQASPELCFLYGHLLGAEEKDTSDSQPIMDKLDEIGRLIAAGAETTHRKLEAVHKEVKGSREEQQALQDLVLEIPEALAASITREMEGRTEDAIYRAIRDSFLDLYVASEESPKPNPHALALVGSASWAHLDADSKSDLEFFALCQVRGIAENYAIQCAIGLCRAFERELALALERTGHSLDEKLPTLGNLLYEAEGADSDKIREIAKTAGDIKANATRIDITHHGWPAENRLDDLSRVLLSDGSGHHGLISRLTMVRG